MRIGWICAFALASAGEAQRGSLRSAIEPAACGHSAQTFTIDLRIADFTVPSASSTYVYYAFSLHDAILKQTGRTPPRAVFAVRFEALVGEMLHHFHLDEFPVNQTVVPGFSRRGGHRTKFLYDRGDSPLCTPPGAGILLRSGPVDSWLQYEIHYNNPLQKQGVTDRSGLRLTLVDASLGAGAAYERVGLLIQGIDSKALRIPARLPSRVLSIACAPPLPAEGIHIFAVKYHAHLLVRSSWSTLTSSSGNLIAYVGCQRQYANHWVTLPEPLRVPPGSVLELAMVFNSSERATETLGGSTVAHEMMYGNYLYLPETPALVTNHFRAYCVPRRVRPRILRQAQAQVHLDVCRAREDVLMASAEYNPTASDHHGQMGH